MRMAGRPPRTTRTDVGCNAIGQDTMQQVCASCFLNATQSMAAVQSMAWAWAWSAGRTICVSASSSVVTPDLEEMLSALRFVRERAGKRPSYVVPISSSLCSQKLGDEES